jgi:cytoskeletal protein RodZ
MSPNSTSKINKPIFQSYFWTAILALFMAVVLSQWAVADPQTTPADQETTKEQSSSPPTEEPLEIPPLDESVTDAQGVDDPTTRIVEPVPDAVITRVPNSYESVPAESDAMHEDTGLGVEDGATPILKAVSLSEKCYEQKDGSFECVCEGNEECNTLKTAEHCEPGTHWGKDGFGGCTKKRSK